MNWSEVVFIISFLGLIYFCGSLVRAWRSPDLRSDLHRIREQRRNRRAARKR